MEFFAKLPFLNNLLYSFTFLFGTSIFAFFAIPFNAFFPPFSLYFFHLDTFIETNPKIRSLSVSFEITNPVSGYVFIKGHTNWEVVTVLLKKIHINQTHILIICSHFYYIAIINVFPKCSYVLISLFFVLFSSFYYKFLFDIKKRAVPFDCPFIRSAYRILYTY